MDIRWLGHACFELSDGDARVLIDPFLRPNNPSAPVGPEDVDATTVLLTHGHADHIADAVAVATRSGAECVTFPEIGRWLQDQGVETVHDPNLGGTVEFDWGWVKLVQAFHTNTLPGSEEAPFSAAHGVPVGIAAGLVVNLGGQTIYHTGDTCLFGDMKLIAERTPVDVALIPIGGHYTMDRHDAAVAAELIGARTVIPMHYDTFPPIETEVEEFKSEVESRTGSKVVVLDPGDTHAT